MEAQGTLAKSKGSSGLPLALLVPAAVREAEQAALREMLLTHEGQGQPGQGHACTRVPS